MGLFHESLLKVERAEKHIAELCGFIESSALDLHSVTIEPGQAWYVDTELVITIHKSDEEFRNKAALIIGDVYHNLRSAPWTFFSLKSSTLPDSKLNGRGSQSGTHGRNS
jgi:hypothetical protein